MPPTPRRCLICSSTLTLRKDEPIAAFALRTTCSVPCLKEALFRAREDAQIQRLMKAQEDRHEANRRKEAADLEDWHERQYPADVYWQTPRRTGKV